MLDCTLPQQYVRTKTGRRITNRLIWVGLGRMPNLKRDMAAIAVEFVSAGRRSRKRDYIDKRQEYLEVGIQQYWIIDRFERTMTVVTSTPDGPCEEVIPEGQTYLPPLLPGFEVPLAILLTLADQLVQEE